MAALDPKEPTVDENVTRDHYARLAANYDQNWTHSPAFMEWLTARIGQYLEIASTDIVADIGCGTGLYSRGLAGKASAVVCVDPSEPMLAQVPRSDRLLPVAASMQDVASGQVTLPHGRFDAILLKEVLHHVSAGERPEVIAGLAGLLRPGGRMLVVMLPARISYPLFGAALELFARQQPDPVGVADEMRAAGLAVSVADESFHLAFESARYVQMVRNRYMSLLSHFSDAEIEAGITEILQAHPGDEIAFDDTFAFITGVAR
jgi:2-polyprenyl-3-methyl-5-hydroxy-6-metoxy-1,4-benzoquinol methylase